MVLSNLTAQACVSSRIGVVTLRYTPTIAKDFSCASHRFSSFLLARGLIADPGGRELFLDVIQRL
jgi:hypothetical protein